MNRNPISPALVRTLAEGPHFTVDELRGAFASGFRGTDRLRAVVHFGQIRCEVCWGLLKELASLGAPPPPAGDSQGRAFDPVLATLQRLVAAYFRPATVDRLRPVLRFWLGNSRFAELGFFRLVLEESRQQALDQQATGLVVARETLDLLERLPFADDFGRRWIDLEALARTYLGDEHRIAGEHELAARHLATAKRQLLRGTGDPELGATWRELRAELAMADGLCPLARGLLDEALELLRRVDVEGREAETWILKGLARLRGGDDRGAGAAFRQALSAMPPGKAPRMRLLAHQHLALAEVRSRRFAGARESLDAARTLETEHTTPLLQAQRLWIEGLFHIGTKTYGKAEGPLRDSLQRFRLLGQTLDAAQVLANLGQLYALTRRTREFEGLEQEFRPLLRARATRNWVLALRERVVCWAKAAGISLPSRSQTLAELDGENKDWIH